MTLPRPVESLWKDLQTARAAVLREVEGLSQAQADWKPAEKEWSVGEIVHHLTVAEINTGKLTTKLLREAEGRGERGGFPSDLTAFAPLPPAPSGPAEAPAVVWPEHGKPIGELVDTMKATRERSGQSIERVATTDPRTLTYPHPRFGPLDLAQWWALQAQHDTVHLAQIREVKAQPGFPGRG